MKITLLSTFDVNGGAPIAAYRLLNGLRNVAMDTKMMVQIKSSQDPDVLDISIESSPKKVERRIFDQILKKEIMQNRSKLSETWFSIPYPGYDLSEIDRIRQSDILNLHWVAGFQSVESVSKLMNLDSSVVWTLHDENPYTGGCHFSAGCKKYMDTCKDCPQLKDNRYQLPLLHLERKIELWNENLTVVTPSKWLADSAKKSRVFNKFRVEVIPNSLETNVFKPFPKEEARNKINLNPNALTLLFGAHTSSEKRKGFNKLISALEYCLKDNKFRKLIDSGDINILTFGPEQEGHNIKSGIEIKSMGYIDDEERLATVYSAADIFVLPSLEDNLPNTMLEAMACGTPVIGFRVGGIPDMVVNGKTGFTATRYNSSEMGRLILKLLFDPDLRKEMSKNCRRLIEEKFNLKDQANSYITLFNDLRKNKSEKKNAVSSGYKHIDTDKKNKSGAFQDVILKTPIQNGYFEIYRNIAIKMLVDKEVHESSLKNEIIKKDGKISDAQTTFEEQLHTKTIELKEEKEKYRKEIFRLKEHIEMQADYLKEYKEEQQLQIARMTEHIEWQADCIKKEKKEYLQQAARLQAHIEWQADRIKTLQHDYMQQISLQKEQLNMQATQITEMQNILAQQINLLEQQQKDQESQNKILKQKLDKQNLLITTIQGSYSFRIGYSVTAPARFIKRLFRRRRENN
jgi:glycosyltransferase involved in cell wall biosynthesis